jgi:hypothetical protein
VVRNENIGRDMEYSIGGFNVYDIIWRKNVAIFIDE